MTVCIQYSRPNSGQREGEIFGLDVAVTNFLTAYFRYGTENHFICRPTDIPSFDHFKSVATAAGLNAENRCIGLDPRHPRQNLGKISCLFRADPLIADMIWTRQQLTRAGMKGYAACGLVHTMSGERIVRAVSDLCLTPATSTDALICPSEAIRDAVQNLWSIYGEYLNHHFGSKYRCPIQTPVIPLGIDTNRFATITTSVKRKQQRQALNLADDEVAILFTGRLSFATKAHPLALFMAADAAAQRTGVKTRLVMFGYFKPQDMEAKFRELAAAYCKTIQVDFVVNTDPRFPEGFWAGADIFTSLSDNIQESFGLTPVEAMACGLPAVISDWNGYRGSVRHGEDGYLISTLTPPPGTGMAIAEAYYNEQNYGIGLMGAVQSTSVDIRQCTDYFAVLLKDAGLRQRLGSSGRERARTVFDWQHVIKAYETLWEDLGQRRAQEPLPLAVPPDWQAMHPAFPNPLQMFSSFPTRILEANDILSIVMSSTDLAALMSHEANYFLPELLLPKESMTALVDVIRRAGTAKVTDILAPFPSEEHDRLLRCLGWMLKHGVCIILA